MIRLPGRLGGLYEKHKEKFWYLFFGGLTTLINIVCFWLLHEVLHIDTVAANTAAWILSVLFAFITNKLYVFESKSWEQKKVLWEFFSFVGARVASGVFDMVFLLFFTEWVFHFPSMPVKIISNIIVIILNYVFSKWIVFRKDRKQQDGEQDGQQ
ncbi:MAG: GtrA family protein [Firmicutes bacterium]|nr:GtrA family protein [Bacillota bacterium]